MSHEFSLAHLSAHQCSPPKLIEIAAKSGYDYVSLRMTAVTTTERIYPLMTDGIMMRETKACLADTGLGVLDVELVRLNPLTEPESYLPFLEAGCELGARAVIAQIPDPEEQRAIDRYSRLCDLAKPYNLNVVLEFVSWTETPDLLSAAAIIRAADRSNGGLLVDMLHFDRSGSAVADLEKIPPEWFHFVHLCDAAAKRPGTWEGIIQEARTDRLFPGEGGLNISAVLAHIPAVPCSLEIPNNRLMQELGPAEYSRRALEAARAYVSVQPAGSRFQTETPVGPETAESPCTVAR